MPKEKTVIEITAALRCTHPSTFGRVRGMCNVCYERCRVLVKEGRTTWTELERLGVAEKPKAAGGW
jgi:hypothetical protein